MRKPASYGRLATENKTTIIHCIATYICPSILIFGVLIFATAVRPTTAYSSQDSLVVAGGFLGAPTLEKPLSNEIVKPFHAQATVTPPTTIPPIDPQLPDNKPPDGELNGASTPQSNQVVARARTRGPLEINLSLMTAGLGVFYVIMLCVMGWKEGITDIFVRVFSVSTVIFAALFLIVAGYDEKQTAPVFGILGTVLGYIFGRSEKSSSSSSSASGNANTDSTGPASGTGNGNSGGSSSAAGTS